jgi:hypothetical protein
MIDWEGREGKGREEKGFEVEREFKNIFQMPQTHLTQVR